MQHAVAIGSLNVERYSQSYTLVQGMFINVRNEKRLVNYA